MKPDWHRTAARNRKVCPLFLGLVLSFCLLVPRFSLGADLEVWFDAITPVGGGGPEGRDFLPGDEMQVRVQLRVLQATGNPFYVRLRIAGDGWREMLTSEGVGREITYAGVRVPTTAEEGKVSLLMDVFSNQDTVALHGRRHAYLNVGCPPGIPEGGVDRLPVGAVPRDMALTHDGRFLYVTSEEEPRITVIDVEEKRRIDAEIVYSEAVKLPAGVAANPRRPEMYIADSQEIHVVDAETHVLRETIQLNPTGELGETFAGDLAVSRSGTEVYATDDRGASRIFIVDLASKEVRVLFLFGLTGSPAGLIPVQVMPDPGNPLFIYVLCQGLSEVIKLDVVFGAILDFVQLADVSDPTALWPPWSMAAGTDKIYVVVNPSDLDLTDLLTVRSKILVLPKNRLGGPGRREILLEGSSIWELVVREDGLVYAIDSYRGEILLLDPVTETEMSRCAIPVEPGGRFLRADPAQSRLFVGGWLAGFLNIVE